ncbi:hypothetical protein [Deinococcus taklimakanensis]
MQLSALIRKAILSDERIEFALTYGSLAQGNGDAFSDVEFYLYTAEAVTLNLNSWVQQVLQGSEFQIHLSVVNEFGTPNFVLNGLLRMELHALPVSRMRELLDWPSPHVYPNQMVVKDSEDRLRTLLDELAQKPGPQPKAEAQDILDRTLNWLTFGLNVLARGERVRALELLGWVQGGLLRLARLEEASTAHWLNASRQAELELSDRALQRYRQITGGLDQLTAAYANAVHWAAELAKHLDLNLDARLLEELQERAARP